MNSFERSSFHLPTIIEAARANGGLIHNLQDQPGVTDALAKHGLHTTSETRHPGSLVEFSPVYGREKSLGTIAMHAAVVLASTEHYQEAARKGQLGTALADDLRAIRTVRGHDVHMASHPQAGKEQKGVVTATRIELGVEGRDTAEKVAVALQGLLRTGLGGKFYPALVGEERKDGLVAVRLPGHDEHAARSLSRASQALMDEELLKRHGVRLPEDKMPYDEWRRRNETFIPLVSHRLKAVRDEYHAGLTITASYRDRPEMRPYAGKRMIGTDPAPVLEAIRDIMNPVIDAERLDNPRRKREQHPNQVDRPLTETDIHLSRDAAEQSQAEFGPPQSRPLTIREKGSRAAQGQRDQIKKSRGEALLNGVRTVVGGIPGPVSATLKYGPKVLGFATGKSDVYTAWQQRKAEAEAGGERLDNLARHLRRLEDDLPIWPGEK